MRPYKTHVGQTIIIHCCVTIYNPAGSLFADKGEDQQAHQVRWHRSLRRLFCAQRTLLMSESLFAKRSYRPHARSANSLCLLSQWKACGPFDYGL